MTGSHDDIYARLTRLETAVFGDVEPEPAGLQPPSNFAVAFDGSTRRATCTWIDPPEGDEIEVHEFNVDPDNTLKTVVEFGVQQRTSAPLRGGQVYAYGLRTRGWNPDSTLTYSDWTPRLEVDVSAPVLPGAKAHPTDLLPALRNWTVMLPTGTEGDPDNGYIIGKSVPGIYFVDGGASGAHVVFRAPANGAHSKGSDFVRCEGRQMLDQNWTKAAWPSKGPQSIYVREAIDTSHLNFPRVNGIQIHDGSDDVMQIMRHDKNGLGVMHADGKKWISIDPHYAGEVFTCLIQVVNNIIYVDYNGHRITEFPKSGTGWFWKVGCYNQTGGAREERPEPDGNYGEVRVYQLELSN